MPRPRACDACSLRKVRCTGQLPCPTCVRIGFKCSFAKRPRKTGPKGPRSTTWTRLNEQVQSLSKEGSTHRPSTVSPPPDEIADRHCQSSTTSPLSSSSSSPATWRLAFTLSDVNAYLEIYEHKMYPVWPVIDVAKLSSALRNNENDCETCALVFAVCAATGAQLKLKSSNQGWNGCSLSENMRFTALADIFAAEAERYRSNYDYRESSTIEAILVPLFLHFYYGAKGKRQTPSFLLREAVSLCQLLALDDEDTYKNMDSEEDSYRRRTFWLLYVTERGHAMQHGTPVCLTKFISLPSSDSQSNPLVLQAFHSLAHLFASVDGVLVGSKTPSNSHGQRYSREILVQIQHELRQNDQWPMEWNEVQRSDVSITQQWLRMLVWQLSLSNVTLSSEPGDDSMSFTYPALVSRDALRSLSGVSLDALVAHGPGMQVKICNITSTLIDVMTCVHSLPPEMFIQTRQILHEFCCHLARLNGNREGLEWVHKRLIESNLLLELVSEPRTISELTDNEGEMMDGSETVYDNDNFDVS